MIYSVCLSVSTALILQTAGPISSFHKTFNVFLSGHIAAPICVYVCLSKNRSACNLTRPDGTGGGIRGRFPSSFYPSGIAPAETMYRDKKALRPISGS